MTAKYNGCKKNVKQSIEKYYKLKYENDDRHQNIGPHGAEETNINQLIKN